MRLKPAEQEYWQRFLDTLPSSRSESLQSAFVTASFAGNAQTTDKLLALYLDGRKTAGSSLKEDFIAAGDPLPKVGNYWILLNSRGEPGCILRTERVVENLFKDVPEEIATAEGDSSLEYWRRGHKKFFEPHLESWGVSNLDDATVVTEFFSIVFSHLR